MVEDMVEDSDLNHPESSSYGGVGNVNDADDGGGFVIHMVGTTHGDCVGELGEHYSPSLGVNHHPQASS